MVRKYWVSTSHLKTEASIVASDCVIYASDYAALEARCAALLADVNQDEGYERLRQSLAAAERYEAQNHERILALEAAITKVHGIIAEYWGPCMASVESLLTLREAIGPEAKSWGPNVTALETSETSKPDITATVNNDQCLAPETTKKQELQEAPMPCPGFDSGACVPGKYCGRRLGYAYPCPGQPGTATSETSEKYGPEMMRLTYDPGVRAMWHEDCDKSRCGIVREELREETRTLVRCLHCGRAGYLPVGETSVCVAVESRQEVETVAKCPECCLPLDERHTPHTRPFPTAPKIGAKQ